MSPDAWPKLLQMVILTMLRQLNSTAEDHSRWVKSLFGDLRVSSSLEHLQGEQHAHRNDLYSQAHQALKSQVTTKSIRLRSPNGVTLDSRTESEH
eukprot:3542908-Amphidinium_carterae.1